MNVKFPVWIIYKKGFYSLFRLVMDFGCYYCHFLRFTSPNVWKWCIDSNEFCLSRCYWGRLEFTMRYETFFIVEGLMVTSRWRTTIKTLFHCFVFHVLIGTYSISLHFPLAIVFIFQGPWVWCSYQSKTESKKEVSGCFSGKMNLLEVVCQWGSITEETNLKYYHMSEGVYNWTIYKLLRLTLVSVWQDSV